MILLLLNIYYRFYTYNWVPRKMPTGKIPLGKFPHGKMPPRIILWILFVSNFIFIEIFDQKLKLISLNIFWFLITICSLSFLRLFISLYEYFWFSTKHRYVANNARQLNWTEEKLHHIVDYLMGENFVTFNFRQS